MKLYIDESGSITANINSRNRFFVIAILETSEPHRVIRQFRRAKSNYVKMTNKSIDITREIKGSEMDYGMKKLIFEELSEKTDCVFHYIIIDNKELDTRLVDKVEVSFNYFLNTFIQRIVKNRSEYERKELFLLIDERNVSTGSLNTLEEYLYIEQIIKNGMFDDVKVKYKDSSTKDLIQVADIFCNTVYRIARSHAVGAIDKKNRVLLKCCNVGRYEYFPYHKNDLDICQYKFHSNQYS